MADVKICDRCRKEIVWPRGILLKSKTHYCHLYHDDFATRTSYDLCTDCYEDFKQFVYGYVKEEANV